RIPWTDLPLEVVSAKRPWPRSDGRRLAGVSAFGMSGTNAHLLVQDADPVDPGPRVAGRSFELIVLSAKSDEALRAKAGQLRDRLRSTPEGEGLGDLAYSLATTRTLMERRVALVAADVPALERALDAVTVDGEIARRTSRPRAGKTAWLFSGQGAQRPGMGRELHRGWPAFRRALDAALAALNPHLDRPLESVMWAGEGTSAAALLDRTEFAQPALFAFELALAALWRSWGVEPDLLIGHSVGEIAAACVAGVFSLEDAARLVSARGRLVGGLPAGGAMVALAAPEADVEEAIRRSGRPVVVAVVNAPSSVVIAGDEQDVHAVVELLATRGADPRPLSVSHAFHSPAIDPVLEPFLAHASTIRYRAPSIEVVSTLGDALTGADLASPRHWVTQLRGPVRFADAVRKAERLGATRFIELGPRGGLLPLAASCLALSSPLLAPSCRSGEAETESVLKALAALIESGAALDVSGVFPEGGRRVDLFQYPWRKERYWPDVEARSKLRDTSIGHPLLGVRWAHPAADAIYECAVPVAALAGLGCAAGAGSRVPESVLLEMVFAAADHHNEDASAFIEEITFGPPLTVDDPEPAHIQVIVSSQGSRVTIVSQREAACPWTEHASAKLGSALPAPAGRLDLPALQERCAERGDEALTEVSLAERDHPHRYGLHPTLLDEAIRFAARALQPAASDPRVLERCGRVLLHRVGASSARVYVRRGTSREPSAPAVDLVLADERGEILARLEGLSFRAVETQRRSGEEIGPSSGPLYRVAWAPAERGERAACLSGDWAVLASADHLREAQALADELGALGARARVGTLEEIAAGAPAANVVFCTPPTLRTEAAAEEAILAVGRALPVARALAEHRVRVWWVTRGAVAAGRGEDVDVASAALLGFGRALLAERPEGTTRLLDVDAGTPIADVLAAQVGMNDEEPEVAWRDGRRYVPRLGRVRDTAASATFPAWGEGTVLFTGGLSALAREAAVVLALQGVRDLVLLGRRGAAAPHADETKARLESLGARVSVVACDVTDRDGLQEVLRTVSRRGPLRAVVHAAGAIDAAPIGELTPERLARVMDAKVRGAWNLHLLTRGLPLEHFVLFSSVAGSLVPAGLAGYAAANAFLDGLAAHRAALGLPAKSIIWGPWAGLGMAEALDASRHRWLARQGVQALTPVRGRALLATALVSPVTSAIAASLEPPRFTGEHARPLPVWQGLVRPRIGSLAGPLDAAVLLRSEPEPVATAIAVGWVCAAAASLLSQGGEPFPMDKRLRDLGFDSLMALELRAALSRRAGVSFPGHTPLEALSIAEIAAWMVGSVRGPDRSRTVDAAEFEVVAVVPAPRSRLFCFHDAGGSAAVFAPFGRLATAGVEVHTVSPVRRGRRASQEEGRRFLREAVDYVRARSDVPFALFGQSLGGLLAWRIAEELAATLGPLPAFVAPSASLPPSLAREGTGSSERGEAVARAAMAAAHPQIRSDVESDLALWRSIPASAGSPLGVEIVAFAALDDTVVTEPQVKLWAAESTKAFALRTLPGDHGFLRADGHARETLLEDLARRLGGGRDYRPIS
ncbi:MAG: SDR family NAD(P)-dependent oxidoreductase, partial [Myxococcales bacterium]|nr:SDR family NAD(P)-dependent oxidoreductase [Myxococcales bacterium]